MQRNTPIQMIIHNLFKQSPINHFDNSCKVLLERLWVDCLLVMKDLQGEYEFPFFYPPQGQVNAFQRACLMLKVQAEIMERSKNN